MGFRTGPQEGVILGTNVWHPTVTDREFEVSQTFPNHFEISCFHCIQFCTIFL